MGLDMFLDKQIYVGYGTTKVITVTRDDGTEIPINSEKVKYIVEDVAYWRKANAIHAWFVDNCQKGVDECQETWVPQEALLELLELCKQVQAQPDQAASLLPCRSGFFFGSTDYDEFYFDDINHTIEVLTEVTQNPDFKAVSFYYHSSW